MNLTLISSVRFEVGASTTDNAKTICSKFDERGKMAKYGICRLCGKKTRLSRDHIQPKCAFNEKDRTYTRLQSVCQTGIEKKIAVSGRMLRNIYQEIQPDQRIGGGIYRRTQCEACNSFLGGTYDKRLGKWCHDALAQLRQGEINIVQKEYTQTCKYPLSILKRVIAMFFSINGEKFAGCHCALSEFVRNHDANNLPARYRFYSAYNINDIVSHIPLQLRLQTTKGNQYWISQIGHPPFVHVMVVDSECPYPGLTDITDFSKYKYEEEGDVDLVFRILPTNSCFAGDFRAAGKLVADDIIVFTTEVTPSYFRIVNPIL